MEFINELLTDVDGFVDANLFFNHKDKSVANVTVKSDARKIEESIILSITYMITFHTQRGELIQRYIGVYSAKVKRRHLTESDELIKLWEHFRYGLIRAINKASGSDIRLQGEFLPKTKWGKEIEMAYSEIKKEF